MGELLTDDEVDNMIRDLDLNKTGRVEYNKFIDLMHGQ